MEPDPDPQPPGRTGADPRALADSEGVDDLQTGDAATVGKAVAKDADAGKTALEAFDAGEWGRKYPAIAMSWRRHWQAVIPFFAFPDEVRRIIYTTNAIEALNSKLRRAVRIRGHFPSDERAMKLLFLVLNLAEKEWRMPPREWAMAKAQFAILFEERLRAA